ncbi:adenylate/guanylate cyclase domain-containing protein, partial [Enterococcus faecium]|uniref:adenylate/guanylate cyclase domain-containing protein n=1 Tax=Enterococcus faecium TaxID=1352 RepID=UPI0034E963DA
VPRNLVKRLLAEGPEALESREREATIMFTDIVGFTSLAEAMTPPEVASFLNHHFALVAQAVEPEGGVIDKYIGDCAMVGWGIVRGAPDHALRAL